MSTSPQEFKILVADDSPLYRKLVEETLGREEYVVCFARNGREASDLLAEHHPALVITDWEMPGITGIELCALIRSNRSFYTYIILLTSNAHKDHIISGLAAGADDYLTKPFHLAELGARVAAIIRRKSFEGKNQVVLNELTLNLAEKEVRIKNKPVDLTRKEYELLLYFISNKNKVIAKNAIAEHLWGDNMDLADNYDFIYTHIKNLRKKLMQAGAADYIKSIYGMGYKFSA